MAEEHMPAVEAQDAVTNEMVQYECAFHILPTIAEGEVPKIVANIQGVVTGAGGTVIAEEMPEHYDLVYEIVTPVQGVKKRFNAAYFGWFRFMLPAEKLEGVVAEIKHTPEVLRYLVIRLTRDEIQKPFSVFEMRREKARLRAAAREDTGRDTVGETSGEVSEELLNQELEKITTS